jgi:ABC-type lipoprotein export system ATPase subunit
MIEVKGLSYTYPSGSEILFPDFTVSKDKPFLLLGESGSGKTPLLHLLGGLLKSRRGSITISGTDMSVLSEGQRDHFRGKNIGFVFQRNHLIAALTVKQNLLLAPYLAGMKRDTHRVDEVLEHLDLGSK